MNALTTLIALLPMAAMAQVTVDVEAGGSLAPGSTVLPYYDPMDITINVGDHVHWFGVSGTHNAYGMHDDFPDNPEEFSSGQPSQDLDYTHTFTIPGLYGYHCTQQSHAATEHGTILVILPQSVQEVTDLGRLVMFPVPASGQLTVDLDGGALKEADVFGVDGRLFRSATLNAGQRNTIDLQGLATGRYVLRLTDAQGRDLKRPFVKE